MKNSNKINVLLIVTVIISSIINLSCKKNSRAKTAKTAISHPIANTGRDTTITLPKDSAVLDGTASTNPDGTITSYKWARISGSVSSNIMKPDSAQGLQE